MFRNSMRKIQTVFMQKNRLKIVVEYTHNIRAQKFTADIFSLIENY